MSLGRAGNFIVGIGFQKVNECHDVYKPRWGGNNVLFKRTTPARNVIFLSPLQKTMWFWGLQKFHVSRPILKHTNFYCVENRNKNSMKSCERLLNIQFAKIFVTNTLIINMRNKKNGY